MSYFKCDRIYNFSGHNYITSDSKEYNLIYLDNTSGSIDGIRFRNNAFALIGPNETFHYESDGCFVSRISFQSSQIITLPNCEELVRNYLENVTIDFLCDIPFEQSEYIVSTVSMFRSSTLSLDNECQMIYILISNLFHNQIESLQEKNTQKKSSIIKQAIDIIHREYADALYLEDIADRLYVNASYLSNAFHKKTGMTFSAYLTHVRLTNAEKLLIETNDLVSDISLRVGFGSSSYFVVCFTREYGVSPLKYRRQKLIETIHR